jgi:hypothetical protein
MAAEDLLNSLLDYACLLFCCDWLRSDLRIGHLRITKNKWRMKNHFRGRERELLCDWRYTVNRFVLAPSPLRLTARIFFLNLTPAAIVLIWHPLWREDGSVIYNCCWSSPAHLFSGPSPMVLTTIFYCPRFETSLFVSSYDSQGYGGRIRLRLHTGIWYMYNIYIYIYIYIYINWALVL